MSFAARLCYIMQSQQEGDRSQLAWSDCGDHLHCKVFGTHTHDHTRALSGLMRCQLNSQSLCKQGAKYRSAACLDLDAPCSSFATKMQPQSDRPAKHLPHLSFLTFLTMVSLIDLVSESVTVQNTKTCASFVLSFSL